MKADLPIPGTADPAPPVRPKAGPGSLGGLPMKRPPPTLGTADPAPPVRQCRPLGGARKRVGGGFILQGGLQ